MNFGFFRELSVIERSPSVRRGSTVTQKTRNYTSEDTLPTFLCNIRRRCKHKR